MRGDRLQAAREEYGESRAELAAAIGVSESAVKHWELGRRDPHDGALLKIALRYGKSPWWLQGLTDDPTLGMQLPTGWEDVIREAMEADLTPDQIATLIRAAAALQNAKRRSQ